MASRTGGGNAAFHNFHNDYLYIVDPNERRRLALNEVDTAPFGRYHIRTIIVTGMGFFTDAYDIFSIDLVSNMLGTVYFGQRLPSSANTAIKAASSGGNILGQLLFGWLADVVGRKRMYGLELVIIIVSTVAQALSSNSPSVSVVGAIIFWRVMMGVGIGGDYPLSAVITSEYVGMTLKRLLSDGDIDLHAPDGEGASLVVCSPCKASVSSAQRLSVWSPA